jgi:hypothetical protein
MPVSYTEKFYSEFVLLTVLSLVAANIWIKIMGQFLDSYNSFYLNIIMALLMTFIATVVMGFLFNESLILKKPKK